MVPEPHPLPLHTTYVLGGVRIVARRTWDGRTAARYERLLRAAEAAGKYEAAAEWAVNR